MTILEIMLGLAIMASILLFGIQSYNRFSTQAHEYGVATNVNLIFNAMSNYYRMNCRKSVDASGNVVSAGLLDPAVTTGTITVAIGTALVTPGYIEGWNPGNPNVNRASGSDNGYYAEFISPSQGTTNVYACVDGSYPPTCTTTAVSYSALNGVTKPGLTSYTVPFISHVAVALPTGMPAAEQTQLLNDLHATCLSADATTSCSSATAGNFLVWERPVTEVTKNITPATWILYNAIKEFNMQYTNDGMGLLSGVSITPSTQTGLSSSQYYLCGE